MQCCVVAFDGIPVVGVDVVLPKHEFLVASLGDVCYSVQVRILCDVDVCASGHQLYKRAKGPSLGCEGSGDFR